MRGGDTQIARRCYSRETPDLSTLRPRRKRNASFCSRKAARDSRCGLFRFSVRQRCHERVRFPRFTPLARQSVASASRSGVRDAAPWIRGSLDGFNPTVAGSIPACSRFGVSSSSVWSEHRQPHSDFRLRIPTGDRRGSPYLPTRRDRSPTSAPDRARGLPTTISRNQPADRRDASSCAMGLEPCARGACGVPAGFHRNISHDHHRSRCPRRACSLFPPRAAGLRARAGPPCHLRIWHSRADLEDVGPRVQGGARGPCRAAARVRSSDRVRIACGPWTRASSSRFMRRPSQCRR